MLSLASWMESSGVIPCSRRETQTYWGRCLLAHQAAGAPGHSFHDRSSQAAPDQLPPCLSPQLHPPAQRRGLSHVPLARNCLLPHEQLICPHCFVHILWAFSFISRQVFSLEKTHHWAPDIPVFRRFCACNRRLCLPWFLYIWDFLWNNHDCIILKFLL